MTTLALSNLSPQARQQLGRPPTQQGALVTSVMAGAQQAGIQAGSRPVTIGGATLMADGDVIVAIDGDPVVSGGNLRGYIENTKRPGDAVMLRVLRQGQLRNVEVTLSERTTAQS